MDFIDKLVKFAFKLYGLWVAAGLIVWAISMVYVWLTQGNIELMVSLITSLVFFMIPFPFDLIITWELDRVSLIGQGFFFFLFLLLLYLQSRNKED